MNKKQRRQLLYELSGYFRHSHMTEAEGIAKAMEIMVGIGASYGIDKNMAALLDTLAFCSIPEKYQRAIVEALTFDPLNDK